MATAGVHTHDRNDSREAEVFRQHYDQLVIAIQNPESLADRLFTRKVIERNLLQKMQLASLTKTEKSRELLLAILDQLVVNPCKFSEVVEALQSDSTLELVVEKVQSIYLAAAHKPKLADLETEMRQVYGWVQLGVCLDLPKDTLEEIHATHGSGFDALGKCKAKMLSTWLERCKNPTWSMLIAALQATGKWATANKIAFKYGTELPSKVLPKGKIPPQVESLDLDIHKKAKVAPLREKIERMHTELHQTEEAIGRDKKELQMLQNELKSLKHQKQSMERYMRLLLKDKQIQWLELAKGREKLQGLELHVRRLERGKTPIPEDVRQKLQQTQESTASFEHEFTQLESKIKMAQEATTSELARIQQMSVKVDAIAQELNDLQYQNKELQQEMQQCEQELDTYLLGRSTSTPSIPDKEVTYYNIMMCAGRVEVKLRQSEIEDYDKKLQEKQTEIGSLKESLEKKQQKVMELEQCIKKAEKVGASSSGYAYAYSHLESVNEMESNATKQLISKLHTENLEYKMQCTMAESQKYVLETEKQALLEEVDTLKIMQTMLQQKIEKPIPKPRPGLRNTKPSLKKVRAHQKPIITESQLLNSQFQLKWRRTADLPLAMDHPHIVQINNTTYCGGGTSGGREANRRVFQYNHERNEWSALPLSPTAHHALAELNGKLISIGGIEHDAPRYIPTNSVYVLEDLQWRKTIPPLATARSCACAITYDSHAIVCGGITSFTSMSQHTCTSTVEVYSSDTNQWTMSSPMPFALDSMSTAIVNEMCYVIGGAAKDGLNNMAACIPLPALIRSAENYQTSTSPSSAVWEVLPNCPLYTSTAAQLGDCILALGGVIIPACTIAGTTDVHLYSPSNNCWRRVTGAKLPIATYIATTTTLPSGDIMLIGGAENQHSPLNTVYIASIHFTSQ